MDSEIAQAQATSPEIEELRKHRAKYSELRTKYNVADVEKAIRSLKAAQTCQCINGVKPKISVEIQRLSLILEIISPTEQ